MLENNFTGYAERAIITKNAIDYEVGQEIENIGSHWTYKDAFLAIGDVIGNNSNEVNDCYKGNYTTIFVCENIKGHEVNYLKLDEIEDEYDEKYAEECGQYGISDGCNSESEVIVNNGKFEVLSIKDDELYGLKDEDGTPGIRTIYVKMI